jgi:hypothetical protein
MDQGMADEERIGSSVFRRAALSLGGFLAFLALVMFVPAGIGWVQGWVFLLHQQDRRNSREGQNPW